MGGPAFTRANGYESTCEVSLDRRVALSLPKHERPVSIRASGAVEPEKTATVTTISVR